MLLLSILLAAPSAHAASDKRTCNLARKQMTSEAWTKYVLDHPEGRCADEAIGQLFVLNLGKLATSISGGDRTKLALSLAQLGRSDRGELDQMVSLLGGGGLDSLWGGSTYDDYGSYGDLVGGLGYGGIGDYGADYEPMIYVSYTVHTVDGSWKDEPFFTVLDATRPTLQSCFKALSRDPIGVYYLVGFDVKEGATTVTSVTQDYSDDGASHADIDACVRESVSTASFPVEVSGTYTYRVELY